MATTQVASVELKITVDEKKSNDLGTSKLNHAWQKIAKYATGTSANQSDLVYSDSATVSSGGTQTYDLSGSLASVLDGSSVVFVELVGFAVINKSTTTTETITIGAGTAPFVGWVALAADAVVIGPGGVLIWTSPLDGGAVTATTADILTLTAANGNIDIDIVIWGRSA